MRACVVSGLPQRDDGPGRAGPGGAGRGGAMAFRSFSSAGPPRGAAREPLLRDGERPDDRVEMLVDRLRNAMDMSDRMQSLEALLEFSQHFPAEVGRQGMPVFTDILASGIADVSMSRTIVEVMLNLVSGGGAGAAANIAAVLMDSSNVQSLLDLCCSKDAYAAITAVQVLQVVQRQAPDSLEAAVLECPAGMQRLIDGLMVSLDILLGQCIQK